MRATTFLLSCLLLGGGLQGCSASGSSDGLGSGRDPVETEDAGVTNPPGSGGGGPMITPPTADAGPVDNTCEAISVEAVQRDSNVLIVLDASGSMSDNGRWSQAVSAVKSVTASLQEDLHFGLQIFPSDDSCGVGELLVSPALNTAGNISGWLQNYKNPVGGTPTAATLRTAAAALSGADGQKTVLLVTDGEPNCNAQLAPCACGQPSLCPGEYCLDDGGTVQAVAELQAAGIQTYVVGIEPNAGLDRVLDNMARAGGTGATEHYKVDDPAQLENALGEIAGTLAACSFELESAPSDIDYVRVQIDGQDVAHTSKAGVNEGWELNGATIELLGGACATLRDGGEHDVDITVECELVLI